VLVSANRCLTPVWFSNLKSKFQKKIKQIESQWD
jgi:hypothetical protein